MTRVLLISFCIVLFTCLHIDAATDDDAGSDVGCPKDCSSDYCPKSRYEDQTSCSVPEGCPAPKSSCGFNQRRAKNGTCISTRDCPAFRCKGKNESYDSCPSYCPGESCSTVTPDGNCPYKIGVVVNCKPACRCNKGYGRLNGSCVTYAECQKNNNNS